MRAIASMSLIFVLAAQSVSATPHTRGGEDETPAVEVEVAGPPHVESEPGRVVAVSFAVYNRSASAHTLWPQWDVPEGWVVVAPSASFRVPPRSRSVRLLSVRIPSVQEPGAYPVRFRAVSSEGEAYDEAELVVTVVARYGVALSVLEAPRLASSTAPHTVRFLASNTGNEDATAHLTLRSRPFQAKLEEDIITITANSDREVVVWVEPPGDLQMRTSNRVRLEARLQEDTTAVAQADAIVDVIPDARRRRGMRPPITALARLSSIGGLTEQGVQAEVEGRWPLSGDSLHALDVLVRTPSEARTGYLQSDRYAIRYTGPRYSALVGDGVYALSPLTSSGRYGFGLGGTAAAGRLGGRAFYRTTRQVLLPESEVGGGVSVHAGRWGTYSVNGLHGTGLTSGTAATLRSEAAVGDAVSIDLEAGASGQERVSPIYRAFLRGHVGPAGFYARTLHRSAEHPGQLSGYSTRALGLSTSVSDGLAFSVAWHDEETVARGVAEAVRRRRFLSAAAIGQRRIDAWVVAGRVEVRHEGLYQSAGPLPVDRTQLQTRLRGSLGYRQVRVTARVAGARILDPFSGQRGTHRLLELETGWRQGPHRIEARLEWEQGASLQSLAPLSRWALRLGGEEYLDERLSVGLDVSGGVLHLPEPVRVGAAWLRAGYRLPSGNRVLGEAQVVLQQGAFTSVAASYRLTLEVALHGPNPLRLPGALVEGVVVDEASGHGLAGVLVMFGGESTLTGPDGRFAFRRPPEGLYYLYLDRVTLGLDRVPTTPMPQLIAVPAQGAVEPIRIPTTRHWTLKGRVGQYEIRGGSGTALIDTVAAGAPRYAVVEAVMGDLRHRETCDADGRFEFRDLPPGVWTVQVVASSAEGHRAAPLRIIIGGDDSELEHTLQLLPVARSIRVLRSERLGVEPGPAPDRPSRGSAPLVPARRSAGERETNEQSGQLGRQILRARPAGTQPQPPENGGAIPLPVADDAPGAQRKATEGGDEPLPEPRRE